jgi:hypothetical protein
MFLTSPSVGAKPSSLTHQPSLILTVVSWAANAVVVVAMLLAHRKRALPRCDVLAARERTAHLLLWRAWRTCRIISALLWSDCLPRAVSSALIQPASYNPTKTPNQIMSSSTEHKTKRMIHSRNACLVDAVLLNKKKSPTHRTHCTHQGSAPFVCKLCPIHAH